MIYFRVWRQVKQRRFKIRRSNFPQFAAELLPPPESSCHVSLLCRFGPCQVGAHQDLLQRGGHAVVSAPRRLAGLIGVLDTDRHVVSGLLHVLVVLAACKWWGKTPTNGQHHHRLPGSVRMSGRRTVKDNRQSCRSCYPSLVLSLSAADC